MLLMFFSYVSYLKERVTENAIFRRYSLDYAGDCINKDDEEEQRTAIVCMFLVYSFRKRIIRYSLLTSINRKKMRTS